MKSKNRKLLKLPLTLFFLVWFGQISAQIDLEAGLQAHYPFNGSAIDLSPNGYHGSVIWAQRCENRNGEPDAAYDFSGGNHYINFGNVLNETFAGEDNQFSISLWVQPASDLMENNVILGKISDFGCHEDERQFVLRLFDTSQVSMTYYSQLTTGHARRVNTITKLQDTTAWYHIVVSYDGTEEGNNGQDRIQIWVDGAEQETVLETATGELTQIKAGRAPMSVGNYLSTENNPCQNQTSFDGKIDDLRIYNRLLSPEELVVLSEADTLVSPDTQVEKALPILVYPNPSNGFLHIEDPGAQATYYRIYDLRGRLMVEHLMENNELSLKSLVAGCYLLELLDETGQVLYSEKLIITL